jgi:hypothetical protein
VVNLINVGAQRAEEDARAVNRQRHAAYGWIQSEVGHVESRPRFQAMGPQSDSSVLTTRNDTVWARV